MMRYPVNAAKALKGIGSEIEIRRSYTFDGIAVGDDAYEIPEKVDVELVLRNVGKELLLTGKIWATLVGSCARCLEPARIPVELEIEELVYRAQSDIDDSRPDEEFPEFYFLEQERFDLGPVIEQSFVLSLPLTPLCRPDCKGLCPVCGTNWNEATCDCKQERVDPRWEALRGLLGEQ